MNGNFIIDAFVSVKENQVLELVVYYFKLFPNEFFEKENVSVFVDVEQSVDVGPDGSSDLPTIGVLQAIQAVSVGVDVLELTHVDEVFAFHNNRKEFEETSYIAFFRIQFKVFSFVDELYLVLVNQPLKTIILEPVHQ